MTRAAYTPEKLVAMEAFVIKVIGAAQRQGSIEQLRKVQTLDDWADLAVELIKEHR